jgi:hypothetical protein
MLGMRGWLGRRNLSSACNQASKISKLTGERKRIASPRKLAGNEATDGNEGRAVSGRTASLGFQFPCRASKKQHAEKGDANRRSDLSKLWAHCNMDHCKV